MMRFGRRRVIRFIAQLLLFSRFITCQSVVSDDRASMGAVVRAMDTRRSSVEPARLRMTWLTTHLALRCRFILLEAIALLSPTHPFNTSGGRGSNLFASW
mmetsp:Transcript_35783/g.94014  ORF Transcript_35783/g.94014 Transcript_35783/m.94014 type:complete len:100 (-) Transcript_35783:1283-1582(-)